MSRNAPKPVDDQVKLKKLLDELTKREENKFCADCGCRGACVCMRGSVWLREHDAV